MGAEPIRREPQARGAQMPRTALDRAIAKWLAHPSVIEILLNPDSRLWGDRLGVRAIDSGILLSAAGKRLPGRHDHIAEPQAMRQPWDSFRPQHQPELSLYFRKLMVSPAGFEPATY